MPYNAWFACASGCKETHPLNEVIYNCSACGGLLEVEHDIEALGKRSAIAWMRLFDERSARTGFPYGSGVWGKKEMICPVVEDQNVVSMFEGNTNLFWAERLGRKIGLKDLWIKLCGNTHTGSFKDLGMTVLVSMVKQMMAEGKPIRAVACASTGDTSAALAAYAAAAGIPAVVFLPKGKVSTAQLIQPIANGALTLALDTDFDGCMKVVQEVTKDNSLYLANSMNSLRMEGQKSISFELIQQFDWEAPDWVIVPGGNLGNISAIGRGFMMMRDLGMIRRMPRLVCAQAAQANPLYLSFKNGFKEYHPIKAGKTLASAIQIGDPVSINRAIRVLKQTGGIVEQATEDELADAVAIADRTGLYNCPHTGVTLAALFKLIKAGTIAPEHRVIVISTAHGLKFTDFKVGYHEGKLAGVTSRYANPPVEVPATASAVLKIMDQRLGEMEKDLRDLSH